MTQNLQKLSTALSTCCLLLGLFGCASGGTTQAEVSVEEPTQSMIVRGTDMESVKELVLQVGGTVTHELRIINAVGARLTAAQQAELLELNPDLRLHQDSVIEASSEQSDSDADSTQSQFNRLIDADRVHREGFTGRGVTVAVLDTGVWKTGALAQDTDGRQRILAGYDAIRDEVSLPKARDRNGHGTHVASIVANSEPNGSGDYNGVAPDADLVVVKAFGNNGKGSYANVIRGLQWVVANRQAYGIRILNLSFSARPRSFYWDDPLNQAVMSAWNSGILVVVSAGNTGPEPMTVGVPGNVPYVVTVGAMTDNFTPGDGTDDVLASFSATGPTAAGFAKPEVVAPGGHLKGSMHKKARIARRHPAYHDGSSYFTMSGTSQAAAVVTGVAALMLDAKPNLKPKDIKCRLLDAARPALDETGERIYSILQQGAGLVNAYDAVHSKARNCANRGMNIRHDMAGRKHYSGRARMDESGTFYILGQEEYSWTGSYARSSGFVWSDDPAWTDSFSWTQGFVWSDDRVWTDGFVWSDDLTEKACVNVWVPQE